MDFGYDGTTERYRKRLHAFMNEHVYPAESVLADSLRMTPGDDWSTPPVIRELQAIARSLGLWNLFLPGPRGAGLTNLQYAPLAEITGRSGKQPGDPVRAADAIIKVVESPAPPVNLILGRNGLERVRAKFTDFMSSIDEWEAVTLSADFPK